jgi:hypothetical protein
MAISNVDPKLVEEAREANQQLYEKWRKKGEEGAKGPFFAVSLVAALDSMFALDYPGEAYPLAMSIAIGVVVRLRGDREAAGGQDEDQGD